VTTTEQPAAPPRVPRRNRPAHPGWAILALAMGGFAIGTTEFVTMGVLPEIAAGVGVTIPADAVDEDLEESARFYEEDNGELHIRSDFLIDDGDGSRNVRVAFILYKNVLFSVHAEDLPVPVAVDAGGEQHDGVDHPAALADLHRQCVGGDEGERAGGVEGPVAELLDVLVEVGCHPGHLRLRQRVDPERLDQLVHPPGGHAGEVAVRDHGDQRGLGALASFEQPLGEVGALPELGDRDVDGADAGVQVAAAVAVALRSAARSRPPVLGAHDGVGIG